MGSYDLCLRALSTYRSLVKADVLAALELLDRAIILDPDYGWALSMAALCHAFMAVNGWSDTPDAHLAAAESLGRRALDAAGDDPEVLLTQVFVSTVLGRDLETAVTVADRVLEINPGWSNAWFASGWARAMIGQFQLAVEHLEAALRLDPLSRYRSTMLCMLGIARFAQGRFGDAVSLIKQSVQLMPGFGLAYVFLAAGHGHLGETVAAREAIIRFGTLGALDIRATAGTWHHAGCRKLLVDGIALAEGENPAEVAGGSGPA
jgi:adenylate cyclase